MKTRSVPIPRDFLLAYIAGKLPDYVYVHRAVLVDPIHRTETIAHRGAATIPQWLFNDGGMGSAAGYDPDGATLTIWALEPTDIPNETLTQYVTVFEARRLFSIMAPWLGGLPHRRRIATYAERKNWRIMWMGGIKFYHRIDVISYNRILVKSRLSKLRRERESHAHHARNV